jgi:hypothetical protein
MIIGAHVMIQSSNDAADKKFFSEVLKMPSVDAGGGFLLYAVPPSEIAIHEGSGSAHELYLMCDNVETFVAAMKKRDLACTPPQNHGWGILTQLTLPGGGKLGVYQPLHQRPKSRPAGRAGARPKPRKAAKSSTKRGARRKAVKQRRAPARRR